jgi:hypothetical protein
VKQDFQRALAAAREHDDPSGRISVIKQAVMTEVRSMDPAVDIRLTDYFNNSIAPDMVLRWPSENRERLLFVRPTGSAGWLLNELPLVSRYRPLMFALEDLDIAPHGNGSGGAADSLGAAASAAGTWITDASGTEAMSAGREQSPILGMLSQALVRGGRGVSDGQEIRNLAGATEGGFDGASRGSVPAVHSAVGAIEDHLDAEQSGRITRLLRAVWEAHGSDAARFPATSSVGKLTADDLSYLLKITSEGSAEFWYRIGRTINTELLGRAEVEDPSPNLQALVSASLDILQAKGTRLAYEPFRLHESEDFPRWMVTNGCLALRGLNWIAYVAARRADEFPAVDETEMPDLKTLRERAAGYHVRITEVRLARADRAATYESTEGAEILGDLALSKIEADLEGARVHKAVALLPDGGSAEIDFPQKTAVGPTSATFLLGSLMRSVLPLLSDFLPEERAGLREFLRGDFEQDTLFPEGPSGDEKPENERG